MIDTNFLILVGAMMMERLYLVSGFEFHVWFAVQWWREIRCLCTEKGTSTAMARK